MKKKQPSTDDFELNGFHSGTVKRHNSHWTVWYGGQLSDAQKQMANTWHMRLRRCASDQ